MTATPTPAPVPRLQLQGVPRVLCTGRAPLMLGAREAVLLAWLHREGPTPRARIAGLLWPDGDDAKARANLRQLLLRLRRAAGDLLTEHDGLLALRPDLSVDPTVDAPADGSAVLRRLLGPLEFDDAPELAQWLDEQRAAQLRTVRRERLAAGQAALQSGDTTAALAEADALLSVDSTAEEAHRLRMEALWARGDRAAAITAWDDCRDALRRSLGITPGALTLALGRRILADEAAGQPLAAGAPPLQGGLPAALQNPPATIGREAEWQTLLQALGAGHGALVAGAGGLGKSRLLAQAAQALQPSLMVGARPGDASLPGALASRLVAAAVERFDPVLDPLTRADIQRLLPGGPVQGPALRSALEHRRVLASVARTMLACHAKGMRLVVVDDLQFADDLSMDAIAVVVGGWVERPPPAAAVPLFGFRPDELRPRAAALVALLRDRPRSVQVDLAPLALAELERLLGTLPLPPAVDRAALAAAVHARVGGNPAFVLEALRALWPALAGGWRAGDALPLPATLVDSVAQRLQRLSPDALQLAQLAAVAESDFSLSLAAAAFGRAPLALAPLYAELEAAQVLDATGFSHDLVAEAVLRSVPGSMKPPLHRLVAEHLTAQSAPAQRIAWHWTSAGDQRAAARWQLQAGERARHDWRMADAARSYEAALDGLDPTAARAERVQAGLHAARCHLWLSQGEQAGQVLDRCEPLARGPAEQLPLVTLRCLLHYNRREVPSAVDAARRLCDALPAHGAQLTAADITAALRAVAVVLPMVHDDTSALELIDRMGPFLDRRDPVVDVEIGLVRGGLLYRMDQPLRAVPDLQAAFDAARRSRQLGPLVALGGELMRSLQALGRAREALGVGQAALAVVQDGGFGAGYEFDLRGQLAMLHFALGEPAEAWVQADAAEACHARTGRPASDVMLRAMLRVMGGALDEAQALLARHAPVPEGPDVGPQVLGQYLARVQSRLDLARGDADAARRSLARASAWGASSLSHRVACAWAGDAVPGDTAARLRLAASASGEAALQRVVALLTARECLAMGRSADARAAVEEAAGLEAAIDPWLDCTALRWLHAAELLEAAGDRAAAKATRRRGREWLLRGASALADPARREAWLHGTAAHRVLAGV
jgi:DNA-binding SARP family transcriptional activator